jgi:hypothetical protein
MIVDTEGDNAGLGYFVAIRFPTSSLPPERNLWGNGYIYVGYAHLSAVSVQATASRPFPIVQPTTPLGMTGSSGTDNIHLDVTTFFVPDNPTTDPTPRSTGAGDGTTPAHENFQSFYVLGISDYYQPTAIDPLVIWPELAIGTTCVTPTPTATLPSSPTPAG